VIKLLAMLVMAYALIVAVLYLAQRALIFPGARMQSMRLDHPRAPERLELATPDGDVLRGMLFRASTSHTDLVIGFGGNMQDAEVLGQDLAARLPQAHVVVFHYRGYGPSTGRPSEAALFADALEIHDAMVARLRPERTFLVGISLGSGVATYLSKQRPLAGMTLVTPFDSIEAIAKEHYFWVPVGLLLRERFASVEHMQANQTPVAVIAAEADRVVRPQRTAALRTQIPNLAFDRTLAGASHASILGLPAYDVAFQEAFEALRRARLHPGDPHDGVETRPMSVRSVGH
jgi:pimeloyl-ACP methyl ester carboxylesterase